MTAFSSASSMGIDARWTRRRTASGSRRHCRRHSSSTSAPSGSSAHACDRGADEHEVRAFVGTVGDAEGEAGDHPGHVLQTVPAADLDHQRDIAGRRGPSTTSPPVSACGAPTPGRPSRRVNRTGPSASPPRPGPPGPARWRRRPGRARCSWRRRGRSTAGSPPVERRPPTVARRPVARRRTRPRARRTAAGTPTPGPSARWSRRSRCGSARSRGSRGRAVPRTARRSAGRGASPGHPEETREVSPATLAARTCS